MFSWFFMRSLKTNTSYNYIIVKLNNLNNSGDDNTTGHWAFVVDDEPERVQLPRLAYVIAFSDHRRTNWSLSIDHLAISFSARS